MTRFLYTFLFFSFSANFVLAQQELSFHFLQDVWQTNQTNPAIMTENEYTVVLPSVYYNSFNTNSSFNELIRTNAEGVKVFDVSNLLGNLSDDNFIRTNLEVQTLGFAYRKDNFQLGLSHGTKAIGWLDYPVTLPKLIWQGNAQYLGTEVSFGPDFNVMAYHELALSAAYQLGNLSFGVKAKYLNGVGEVSTIKKDISLYTDPSGYDLSFETDLAINSSAFLEIESLTDFNFSLSDVSFGKVFTKNTGLAIDLGLQAKLGDNITLSASVLDLGSINWKEDVRNYTSKGNFTYEGLDVMDIINADSISFENTIDTLDQLFNFVENNNSYSSSLPTKYYLSGLVQLNEQWELGALFYGLQFRGEFQTAFALSGRAKINEYLKVGATYAIRNNSFTNLGLNLTFNYGPLQVFAVTDNIFSAFTPLNSKRTNGRIGLGLLF